MIVFEFHLVAESHRTGSFCISILGGGCAADLRFFRRIAAKISTQGKRLSRGPKMLRRAAGAVSASIFDAYVSSRPPSKATGRLADVLSNAASEFQ